MNALPPETYQQIADDYRELLMEHGFRGLITRVAERHGITYKLASSRISHARKYGFLEPYTGRQCFACQQPIPRSGAELEALETVAADHAEIVQKLAAQADESGNYALYGALRTTAAIYRQLTDALIVATDLNAEEKKRQLQTKQRWRMGRPRSLSKIHREILQCVKVNGVCETARTTSISEGLINGIGSHNLERRGLLRPLGTVRRPLNVIRWQFELTEDGLKALEEQ